MKCSFKGFQHEGKQEGNYQVEEDLKYPNNTHASLHTVC